MKTLWDEMSSASWTSKETQKQNKIAINLLKDKSAFIPESVCLKSKQFEIRG